MRNRQTASTMNLICNIGRRVPRVYIRDGKEVGEVNYLRRELEYHRIELEILFTTEDINK